MSSPHRSLKERLAAIFGWRRAYTNPTDVDRLLAEQSETAYTQGAGHAIEAGAKNDTALAVQPGVLDVRGRALVDVIYLQVLLTVARNRDLDPALIKRLEAAVEHGHEFVVLLAAAARATATTPARVN